MTSDLPITTRNFHAKLVLTSGARVTLREVLFGEQVQIGSGRFATEVTPMSHGRFRLIQMKEGVKAPIDIAAQHIDRITRRGPVAALGPMPKPAPDEVDIFDVTASGLPYRGKVQMFLGRGAIHGTDDKTGAERVVLLRDVQSMEVKRRKPEPRIIPPSELVDDSVEVESVVIDEAVTAESVTIEVVQQSVPPSEAQPEDHA